MKKYLIFIIAFLISAQAFALELQDAKDQGLVGETNSGFVAPITSSPSSEVRRLVSTVNTQREASYKRISVSHGLSPSEVGRLAYKKAIEKTRPGHYYQNSSGKWVKK
ncbi:YdbL family protein [Photobacterium sanguinicancri]|uniref:YdbL family protein n=1 Tax=Photobacterium sanguinicancri TaxID=875932 RepID=UPI0026E23FE1|nr:YdbL family protein [Photobacterium sanguinicancri]MDO6499224.1 YdbL family protein [Photobacterium sanguinicancri]